MIQFGLEKRIMKRIIRNKIVSLVGKERLTQMKMMKGLYLIALIPLLHVLVFKYGPMYGLLIAFKDFSPAKGIWGSPWNNFAHFKFLFSTSNLWTLIRNTLTIGTLNLLFRFPAAIIFALMINEVRNVRFKKISQSISYLPHFLSWVVVGSMAKTLLSTDRGPINALIIALGGEKVFFLTDPVIFIATLVGLGVWKEVGWSSIIYLASLSGVNPNLYDAADIDGASRFHKILYINLPAMVPAIVILLILNVGEIMELSFDQIFNLYNPLVYGVADVFDTYIYRVGMINMRYDYSTAIGLFKTVVSFILLISANAIAKRVTEYSLW